jgi:acetyl-CoA C-acetyltransferase
MPNGDQPIWLAAGVRSPFVAVDGPFAGRDSLMLSVPVAQAMAEKVRGSIDFAVWGAVVQNLAYANLAREIWLEAKLDPHVPTFTTVMQCSTSMVGVFEAAGMLARGSSALAVVGGVESMTRVQIGLGQNLSDWLRHVVQARSAGQRLSAVRKLRPRDIRLFVPEVKNRVTGRSMGEHTEDGQNLERQPRAAGRACAAKPSTGSRRSGQGLLLRSDHSGRWREPRPFSSPRYLDGETREDQTGV